MIKEFEEELTKLYFNDAGLGSVTPYTQQQRAELAFYQDIADGIIIL
jgi:hypothetical protein